MGCPPNLLDLLFWRDRDWVAAQRADPPAGSERCRQRHVIAGEQARHASMPSATAWNQSWLLRRSAPSAASQHVSNLMDLFRRRTGADFG